MSLETTTPISPARFAEALKELPSSSLALKVLEIRNSIAHLDYSNAELKPFAEGRALTLASSATAQNSADATEPDRDCIEAIAENEAVIARMQERIQLIRHEVEDRGLSWAEFHGEADKEEPREPDPSRATSLGTTTTPSGGLTNGVANGVTNGVNGHHASISDQRQQPQQHRAWRDGTFQTGVTGEEVNPDLLRRVQDPASWDSAPDSGDQQDDGEGGMHL